jgi:hypothetical protein
LVLEAFSELTKELEEGGGGRKVEGERSVGNYTKYRVP